MHIAASFPGMGQPLAHFAETIPAPLPPARRNATRTTELRLLIADEIIAGRLAPGTPLEEVEIAKRYGVSRTPVREALRELAASGLVEARPHRSALVARPSEERLRSMVAVMAELEAMAAGLCAQAMGAAVRLELDHLHAEMAETVRAGDCARYDELDSRFHAAVATGSHNSYLAELLASTRARLQPFRQRERGGDLGRLALGHQGHARILEAILRGDRATAQSAMRAHILGIDPG